MKFKIVKINGKNVASLTHVGYRGGISEYTVHFHDGTEQDMSETEIRQKAECVYCDIEEILGD